MSSSHRPDISATEIRAAEEIVRLPFIDGLRGFAALVVCLCHAVLLAGSNVAVHSRQEVHSIGDALALLVSPGGAMVWLFLMVSSFSLYYSEDVRRLRGAPTTVLTFLRRRAWRILPLYYVALLVALPGALLWSSVGLVPFKVDPTPAGIISHLILVHNLQPIEWAYQINAPLWSIAWEVQLYAFFPLLYFAARRWFLVTLGLVVVLFVGLATQVLPDRIVLAYWFALGVVLASVYRKLPDRVVPALLPVGAVALIAAWIDYPSLERAGNIAMWSVGFGALLLWMSRRPASLNPCSSKMMRWVGVRSYSLYALHFPVLWALLAFARAIDCRDDEILWVTLAAGVPLSLIAAAVSYRWIESPSLQRARG